MTFVITDSDAEEIRLNTRARKRAVDYDKLRRRGGSYEGNTDKVIRVKAQEDWQTDGTVSVKRLNGKGVQTGDAFDAYILIDKSATDVTNVYWPPIDLNDILYVAKDKEGDYVVIDPQVRLMVGMTLPAATQQVWQSNGKISCKLLNNSGVAAGTAFNVFIHSDKASTDPTSGYGPVLGEGDEILIAMDKEGDWILVSPDVQPHVITDIKYNSTLHKFQVQYSSAPTTWVDPDNGAMATESLTVVDDVDTSGTALRQKKNTTVYVMEDGTASASTSTVDAGTTC